MGILVQGLKSALELVIPELCCQCRRPAGGNDRGMCGDCRAELRRCSRPFCERCAEPLDAAAVAAASAAREDLCVRCRSRPEMPRVRAYARFEGELLPDLLARYKYGREVHLSRPLADLVWRVAQEHLVLSRYQAVVPVPLHDARLLQRGFNQSALLARRLCKESGLPLLWALRRIEPTRSQVFLDARQRGQNLLGSFESPKRFHDRVDGRRLLLVDDVVTTGQTVTECALALYEVGALEVDVICLARTPQRQNQL